MYGDPARNKKGAYALFNDAVALASMFPENKLMAEMIEDLRFTIVDAVEITNLIAKLSPVMTDYFSAYSHHDAAAQALDAQNFIVELLKNEQDDGAQAALYEMYTEAASEVRAERNKAVEAAQRIMTNMADMLEFIRESKTLTYSRVESEFADQKEKLIELVELMSGNAEILLMSKDSLAVMPPTSVKEGQHRLVILTKMRGVYDLIIKQAGNLGAKQYIELVDENNDPVVPPAGSTEIKFEGGKKYILRTFMDAAEVNLDDPALPKQGKIWIETTMLEPTEEAAGWIETVYYRPDVYDPNYDPDDPKSNGRKIMIGDKVHDDLPKLGDPAQPLTELKLYDLLNQTNNLPEAQAAYKQIMETLFGPQVTWPKVDDPQLALSEGLRADYYKAKGRIGQIYLEFENEGDAEYDPPRITKIHIFTGSDFEMWKDGAMVTIPPQNTIKLDAAGPLVGGLADIDQVAGSGETIFVPASGLITFDLDALLNEENALVDLIAQLPAKIGYESAKFLVDLLEALSTARDNPADAKLEMDFKAQVEEKQELFELMRTRLQYSQTEYEKVALKLKTLMDVWKPVDATGKIGGLYAEIQTKAHDLAILQAEMEQALSEYRALQRTLDVKQREFDAANERLGVAGEVQTLLKEALETIRNLTGNFADRPASYNPGDTNSYDSYLYDAVYDLAWKIWGGTDHYVPQNGRDPRKRPYMMPPATVNEGNCTYGDSACYLQNLRNLCPSGDNNFFGVETANDICGSGSLGSSANCGSAMDFGKIIHSKFSVFDILTGALTENFFLHVPAGDRNGNGIIDNGWNSAGQKEAISDFDATRIAPTSNMMIYEYKKVFDLLLSMNPELGTGVYPMLDQIVSALGVRTVEMGATTGYEYKPPVFDLEAWQAGGRQDVEYLLPFELMGDIKLFSDENHPDCRAGDLDKYIEPPLEDPNSPIVQALYTSTANQVKVKIGYEKIGEQIRFDGTKEDLWRLVIKEILLPYEPSSKQLQVYADSLFGDSGSIMTEAQTRADSVLKPLELNGGKEKVDITWANLDKYDDLYNKATTDSQKQEYDSIRQSWYDALTLHDDILDNAKEQMEAIKQQQQQNIHNHVVGNKLTFDPPLTITDNKIINLPGLFDDARSNYQLMIKVIQDEQDPAKRQLVFSNNVGSLAAIDDLIHSQDTDRIDHAIFETCGRETINGTTCRLDDKNGNGTLDPNEDVLAADKGKVTVKFHIDEEYSTGLEDRATELALELTALNGLGVPGAGAVEQAKKAYEDLKKKYETAQAALFEKMKTEQTKRLEYEKLTQEVEDWQKRYQLAVEDDETAYRQFMIALAKNTVDKRKEELRTAWRTAEAIAVEKEEYYNQLLGTTTDPGILGPAQTEAETKRADANAAKKAFDDYVQRYTQTATQLEDDIAKDTYLPAGATVPVEGLEKRYNSLSEEYQKVLNIGQLLERRVGELQFELLEAHTEYEEYRMRQEVSEFMLKQRKEEALDVQAGAALSGNFAGAISSFVGTIDSARKQTELIAEAFGNISEDFRARAALIMNNLEPNLREVYAAMQRREGTTGSFFAGEDSIWNDYLYWFGGTDGTQKVTTVLLRTDIKVDEKGVPLLDEQGKPIPATVADRTCPTGLVAFCSKQIVLPDTDGFKLYIEYNSQLGYWVAKDVRNKVGTPALKSGAMNQTIISGGKIQFTDYNDVTHSYDIYLTGDHLNGGTITLTTRVGNDRDDVFDTADLNRNGWFDLELRKLALEREAALNEFVYIPARTSSQWNVGGSEWEDKNGDGLINCSADAAQNECIDKNGNKVIDVFTKVEGNSEWFDKNENGLVECTQAALTNECQDRNGNGTIDLAELEIREMKMNQAKRSWEMLREDTANYGPAHAQTTSAWNAYRSAWESFAEKWNEVKTLQKRIDDIRRAGTGKLAEIGVTCANMDRGTSTGLIKTALDNVNAKMEERNKLILNPAVINVGSYPPSGFTDANQSDYLKAVNNLRSGCTFGSTTACFIGVRYIDPAVASLAEIKAHYKGFLPVVMRNEVWCTGVDSCANQWVTVDETPAEREAREAKWLEYYWMENIVKALEQYKEEMLAEYELKTEHYKEAYTAYEAIRRARDEAPLNSADWRALSCNSGTVCSCSAGQTREACQTTIDNSNQYSIINKSKAVLQTSKNNWEKAWFDYFGETDTNGNVITRGAYTDWMLAEKMMDQKRVESELMQIRNLPGAPATRPDDRQRVLDMWNAYAAERQTERLTVRSMDLAKRDYELADYKYDQIDAYKQYLEYRVAKLKEDIKIYELRRMQYEDRLRDGVQGRETETTNINFYGKALGCIDSNSDGTYTYSSGSDNECKAPDGYPSSPQANYSLPAGATETYWTETEYGRWMKIQNDMTAVRAQIATYPVGDPARNVLETKLGQLQFDASRKKEDIDSLDRKLQEAVSKKRGWDQDLEETAVALKDIYEKIGGDAAKIQKLQEVWTQLGLTAKLNMNPPAVGIKGSVREEIEKISDTLPTGELYKIKNTQAGHTLVQFEPVLAPDPTRIQYLKDASAWRTQKWNEYQAKLEATQREAQDVLNQEDRAADYGTLTGGWTLYHFERLQRLANYVDVLANVIRGTSSTLSALTDKGNDHILAMMIRAKEESTFQSVAQNSQQQALAFRETGGLNAESLKKMFAQRKCLLLRIL